MRPHMGSLETKLRIVFRFANRLPGGSPGRFDPDPCGPHSHRINSPSRVDETGRRSHTA